LLAHHKSTRTAPRRFLTAAVIATCLLIGPAAPSAAAQAPVNNLAPEVVGNPLVGERLVCAGGSWSGAVTRFTYRWLREGIPVASAALENTYKVTAADQGASLWCIVTAINGAGSTEAESSNSITIPGHIPETPPRNTSPPQVSGNPAVGETLSCSPGTWSGSPAPAFTYRWVRDPGRPTEAGIELAATSTYDVVAEDAGHPLACEVTATNGAGTESKLSKNSLSIPGTKPEAVLPPVVLGVEPVAVGDSLTCSPGTWNGRPAPVFSYQWLRDGQNIAGATRSTYTVGKSDQLHALSCRVTATNSEGSAAATSSNSRSISGEAPANLAPPQVRGVPVPGHVLICEKGTWTGLPAPTYAYLWVRDQGIAGEEAIGSSEIHTVAAADTGHLLSCQVTASNSEGSASRASAPVVVPVGPGLGAPRNTALPSVSGEAALGNTLSCSEGTWTANPAPALTYVWLRDGSAIAAATKSTYVVVEADQGHSLSCQVTAFNNEGVASAESAGLAIPGVAPESVERPQVSGIPVVGQQLTCMRGTWKGAPTPSLTVQWLRNGANIASATASSYLVAPEDLGASLACRVTASNREGRAEATSGSVEIPGGKPKNLEQPTVSGTPAVGEPLICSPGIWSGAPPPVYTYQWLLNGVDIPSATASTLIVTSADRGLELSCEVTAHNREGSATAGSNAVRVPGVKPEDTEAPHVEAPQASGIAAAGQQLTCVRGTWNGQPPPTFTYQWLRDGAGIASATSNTYVAEIADKGHVLSCNVTATNSEGRAEASSSNSVEIVRGTLGQGGREAIPPPSVIPALSAAEVLTVLRTQLARVQHRARISSLRRRGLYAFSVAAPGPGTLELVWYQTAQGARHSQRTKPLVVALSTTAYASAGTKSVSLRLTSAGRRLMAHSSSLELTLKGVFVQPQGRPLVWLKTVVLHY
jgi:hypothetical protein